MNRIHLHRSLLPAAIALAIAPSAFAAVTLYEKDGTSVSTDASFNTFYVDSSTDNEISGQDRDQSRVKMGFLPNVIGFNFSNEHDAIKLGGRASFWVTINDSDSKLTDSAIDTRQFYGTAEGSWGQVLLGKDFTLFNRSNIFQDEILLGYGQVNDTLGLIDGDGVSFGNIGSGYTYPFPNSQLTYRTPELGGLELAVGLVDPSRTAVNGEEDAPRLEGELTFTHAFGKAVSLYAWCGFLTQSSESHGGGSDVDSEGVSYGAKLRLGGLSLGASGYDAKGVGFLLGPGGDATLGLPLIENGDEVDSNGYLLQAAYTLGKVRLVGSYGRTDYEVMADWTDETSAVAMFYDLTSNFRLVAEYDISTLEIGGLDEEAKTVALGLIVTF